MICYNVVMETPTAGDLAAEAIITSLKRDGFDLEVALGVLLSQLAEAGGLSAIAKTLNLRADAIDAAPTQQADAKPIERADPMSDDCALCEDVRPRSEDFEVARKNVAAMPADENFCDLTIACLAYIRAAHRRLARAEALVSEVLWSRVAKRPEFQQPLSRTN